MKVWACCEAEKERWQKNKTKNKHDIDNAMGTIDLRENEYQDRTNPDKNY